MTENINTSKAWNELRELVGGLIKSYFLTFRELSWKRYNDKDKIYKECDTYLGAELADNFENITNIDKYFSSGAIGAIEEQLLLAKQEKLFQESHVQVEKEHYSRNIKNGINDMLRQIEKIKQNEAYKKVDKL